MVKLSSLGISFGQIFVTLVITTAVVMVISVAAMEASPMAMKLHVPLKAGSTLVTLKHTGGKMASFDVSH